jgi:hypothetical protein
MRDRRQRGWAGVLAAIGVAFATAAVHAAVTTTASVDAVIEPAQIAVGESAQLTVTATGSGTLSVPLPVVSGLEFRVVGQSRRIEIINGATIASTSTIIRVTAEEAGVFTIPGLTPNSPPLVLRVNPSGSTGPSLAPNPSNEPGRSALTPGQTDANGIRLTPDGSTYVRFEVPKHEIYVGESVAAEIQIGMRDGFATSINGLPKLNSSDFTLNNLSLQPEKSAKVIDGKPFTVYTWRSVLAAIKPGSYSLDFAAPVTVRIRTQPRRDSLLDDLLGDPFMQNVFGSFVTKNLTVTSPETAFTVLPLPAEGRPADFGGAVGSFKVSSDVSSAANTAGDPLTLRLHVSGSGSFDRVDSSMLTGDPQWRTYQPKATFSPAEPTGFRGEKIFEQPIIATQPGSQTIPALAFSYFDPSARRYETVKSGPLHVTVAPSAADSAAAPPPALAGTAAAPARQPRDGLRPDHAPTAARVDSLTPLYLRPMFLGAESTLALLLGASWIAVHRRERNARDLQRQLERQRRETLEALLKQMAAAAAAGDTALFFTAARTALQHALGAAWHIEPDQVTATELEARLDGPGDDVKRIFTLADEANYSGAAPRAAHFEGWTRTVQRRVFGEETP